MKNIILIGGGDIATHYNALLEDPDLNLMALCDLNPNCPARDLFRDIPFIQDYRKFPAWDQIDHAIVAATAAAHYNIISDLLRQGISVVSEKPLAGSMEEIHDLYRLAQENHAELRVLFHWRYLIETEWLTKEYRIPSPIKRIRMDLCDNYATGGSIRPDRRGMMGAWADCGINALSFTDLFIPAENLTQISAATETDPACGYPVYAARSYTADGIPVEITVDWRTPSRDKIFTLEFQNGDIVDIIHRKGTRRQEIDLNGHKVREYRTHDSLADQYRKMFREVIFGSFQENKNLSLRLHKILYL